MIEIRTLGVGRVRDAATDTPIPPVARALLEIDVEANDYQDLGEVPMFCALGVTALPAPPDDNGRVEGIIVEGGEAGICLGARDTRCPDVVGRLRAGGTVLHNTGGTPATRSRVICQENVASIIVGNDVALVIDRKNSKIQIMGFGHIFEMSKAQGISMATKGAKAGIHIMENGTVDIIGSTINLGGIAGPGTPATAVLCGPSGITGVPSSAVGAGVYIRP